MWVKDGSETELGAEMAKECFPEVRGEPRVAVRNHEAGDVPVEKKEYTQGDLSPVFSSILMLGIRMSAPKGLNQQQVKTIQRMEARHSRLVNAFDDFMGHVPRWQCKTNVLEERERTSSRCARWSLWGDTLKASEAVIEEGVQNAWAGNSTIAAFALTAGFGRGRRWLGAQVIVDVVVFYAGEDGLGGGDRGLGDSLLRLGDGLDGVGSR